MKSEIHSAKLDYLNSLLNQARQAPRFAASLWSEFTDVVRRPKNRKSAFDSHLSVNDINQLFQKVPVSTDHRTTDCYVSPRSLSGRELFHFEPLDSSVVVSLLMKLDIRKSTGPDGLSGLFLQWVSESIDFNLINIWKPGQFHLFGKDLT